MLRFTATWGPIIRNLVIPLAIVVAILGGSFLIVSGGFWLFDKTGPGAVKAADQYAVLRDVLVITLSATALFIAIFGTGAFFLLRRLLTDYISRETLERSQQAIARSLINQGYGHWGLYEETGEEIYVVQAIRVTREAYDNVKSLSEKKRENEELISKQLGMVPGGEARGYRR